MPIGLFRNVFLGSAGKYYVDFMAPGDGNGDGDGDQYWSDVAYLVSAETGFVDLSDNGSTITPTNAEIETTLAATGTQSIKFDGTIGSKLVFANNATVDFGTGDFTIEWFSRFTNITDISYIFDARKVSDGLPAFYVYYGSGKLLYSGGEVGASTIAINTWHHIAFVRISGTLTVYVDGILKDTLADTSNWSGVNLLWNNRYSTENYGDWVTYLDGIRVTAASRYTTNFTPPTEPFPTYSLGGDPYWDNVVLLSQYDTDFSDLKGRTVTPVGSPSISTTVTKFGVGSLELSGDATDDSLLYTQDAALDLGTGLFTMEIWHRSTGAYLQTLLSDWDGVTAGAFLLYVAASGETVIYMIGSSAWPTPLTSSAPINSNDGEWHHTAMVRDTPTTIKLYVDGTLGGTITLAAGQDIATTASLSVGKANTLSTQNWKGNVEEFRITKGIARYTENFTPPTEAFPTSG